MPVSPVRDHRNFDRILATERLDQTACDSSKTVLRDIIGCGVKKCRRRTIIPLRNRSPA